MSTSRSVASWKSPIPVTPSTPGRLSRGPLLHVYSHFGCKSEDLDGCAMCRYLLQQNSHLYPNARSLITAANRSILPPIRPHPTPIQPIRRRIDSKNDLYLLQKVPGTPRTQREAEDAAIINICMNDKSIDRIVLVDGDDNEEEEDEDDDVLFVRLYDLEKRYV